MQYQIILNDYVCTEGRRDELCDEAEGPPPHPRTELLHQVREGERVRDPL